MLSTLYDPYNENTNLAYFQGFPGRILLCFIFSSPLASPFDLSWN